MSPRSTARHLRVPRPAAHPRDRSCFSGLEVLGEQEGELALLLWQAVRAVELWGAPGPRLELFAPGAAALRRARLEAATLDPELREALERVSVVLENPGGVEAGDVVEACRRAAAWAERSGKLGTAVAFAQAAAAADPESASVAVLVGRLARVRAEYERAEGWFEHAVVLARQAKDWHAYTEAYAGLGNLYVQKGSLPRAKQCHLRCLRQARRRSLHEMEGAAFHNLFVVAGEAGNAQEAEECAGKALSAYPAGSRGVLRLAYDVAYWWVLRDQSGRAFPVAHEIVATFGAPADRVLALGLLARAAGDVGEAETFETAWAGTWVLLSDPGAVEGLAHGLLGLAHGAARLAEWTRAERALRKSIEIASGRREEAAVVKAEALLASVLERAAAAGPAPAPAATVSGDGLAREFVQVLRERRAAASFA